MPKKIADMTLYTLQEISRTLDVTTGTLRTYIKNGKIKAKKVAGKWIVTDSALREYFKKGDHKKKRNTKRKN